LPIRRPSPGHPAPRVRARPARCGGARSARTVRLFRPTPLIGPPPAGRQRPPSPDRSRRSHSRREEQEPGPPASPVAPGRHVHPRHPVLVISAYETYGTSTAPHLTLSHVATATLSMHGRHQSSQSMFFACYRWPCSPGVLLPPSRCSPRGLAHESPELHLLLLRLGDAGRARMSLIYSGFTRSWTSAVLQRRRATREFSVLHLTCQARAIGSSAPARSPPPPGPRPRRRPACPALSQFTPPPGRGNFPLIRVNRMPGMNSGHRARADPNSRVRVPSALLRRGDRRAHLRAPAHRRLPAGPRRPVIPAEPRPPPRHRVGRISALTWPVPSGSYHCRPHALPWITGSSTRSSSSVASPSPH